MRARARNRCGSTSRNIWGGGGDAADGAEWRTAGERTTWRQTMAGLRTAVEPRTAAGVEGAQDCGGAGESDGPKGERFFLFSLAEWRRVAAAGLWR